MTKRARLAGQAFLGLATLLFVGSAVAVVSGVIGVETLMTLGVVAVCCLVGGTILAWPS
ncbi:hypothetical protein ACOZ4L_12765 [Haloplanus ruber]|uniref:Major facilitator superfamily (MFS) profile domain-containing protein n=1 Tax=Haloplanus ruber TaxID=869892 RepID=A0ABD6CZH8_9EURY|nr:hypothetical protein [Haloplanus ruber]